MNAKKILLFVGLIIALVVVSGIFWILLDDKSRVKRMEKLVFVYQAIPSPTLIPSMTPLRERSPTPTITESPTPSFTPAPTFTPGPDPTSIPDYTNADLSKGCERQAYLMASLDGPSSSITSESLVSIYSDYLWNLCKTYKMKPVQVSNIIEYTFERIGETGSRLELLEGFDMIARDTGAPYSLKETAAAFITLHNSQ